MTTTPRPAAPADSLDDALRRHEHRRLCYDGWFWPVKRHLMRDGLTIRARMVEDLQILSLDFYPDLTRLAALGWSLDQLGAHGPHALHTFFHGTP